MQKYITFFTSDIWSIHLDKLSFHKSLIVKILRILLLSFKKFFKDECPLMASSLTFYSLLSVVPIAALVFGIAKGFGFEKILEKRLLENFAGQEEIIFKVINFAKTLIDNTKEEMIAGIGAIFLIWSVMKVFGYIESSLNKIWKIRKQRSFGRKFSDYLSLTIIAPLLFILYNSAIVFLIAKVTMFTKDTTFLYRIGPFLTIFFKFLPHLIIWILFTIIYLFIPNKKINATAGILGAIIAGSLYQIVQITYISFQVGVSKYNAIYGSFSAFPLFLIWLQLSWLIVLFGAELSYAFENINKYEFFNKTKELSLWLKKKLALQTTYVIVKNFSDANKPLTLYKISDQLNIPEHILEQVLLVLTKSKIITQTVVEKKEQPGYIPAIDTDKISVEFVLNAIDKNGSVTLPYTQSKELEAFSKILNDFYSTIKKSPSNHLLKDL